MPKKKLHPMAQTHKQINGHGDSMTNSAQWGRVGENDDKDDNEDDYIDPNKDNKL